MRARSLVAATLLLALCNACHKSPEPGHTAPVATGMQQSYADALATDATQHALAPSALVALHQDKGVGLGLQITGRTFRVGQNIPLVLAYENVSATEPVSSTNCSGFAIALEDTDHQKDDLASISPCQNSQSFAQNNMPLEQGNLRFLHTSLFAVRLVLTHPGKYLINASWQSFRPRDGGFRKDDTYAVVRSNIIPIVVTP